ncbi:MAG: NAD-dependent epimerase/dehydratase family protein [Pseudomonadota bacterium]
MARYLVTGGAGFIGSHLVEALVSAGHDVVVLDDLSTGKRENVPGAVDLIVGDVADKAAVADALRGADGCFHLAAVSSVQASVDDWTRTHAANLSGAVAVFDAAKRFGALRDDGRPLPVVYASSAAVYGDNLNVPLNEGEAPQPLSAYAADKYGCELHAAVGRRLFNAPFVGLRFFNVYGPRQDPSSPYSGVISIFVNKIAAGEEVTIFGDGGQTRDFIYVGDVVAALNGAMARAGDPATPPVVNVCRGAEVSVKALAETLGRICEKTPAIRHADARPGDIRASVGDPARLNDALGVVAQMSFEDGLARTVAWSRGR